MSDPIVDIEYRDGVEISRTVHEADSDVFKVRTLAMIDSELAEIDRKLDRNDEDQWAAIQKIADAVGAGDVTPPAKKVLIERKAVLRQKRAALT